MTRVLSLMPILLLLFTPVPSRADARAALADEDPGEMPVVAEFDFEDGSLRGWTFTDADAWRLAERTDGGHALVQHRASRYEPEVRSPLNIALAPDVELTDFEVTLKVRSTAREYGHRDICLFFGHQDPAHFYYVHIATAADPHAHSIFLVDGAPRASIARERTEGVRWTEGWHEVKLVRRVQDGLIEVYFDDMSRPIMSTRDTTFTRGRFGVGTFDDTAMFDDIVIRGREADAAAR